MPYQNRKTLRKNGEKQTYKKHSFFVRLRNFKVSPDLKICFWFGIDSRF